MGKHAARPGIKAHFDEWDAKVRVPFFWPGLSGAAKFLNLSFNGKHTGSIIRSAKAMSDYYGGK